MTHDPTNRSLERGIVVLETLAQRGACSLSDLHHITGLPKSTLRRLLTPLVSHHLVRRSLGDQLYRINVALPSIGRHGNPRVAGIVEVASPHMIELTRRIKWPSELHLHDQDHMWVIESTRMHSPFALGSAKMDLEVSLFGAASGRAYLATLGQDEITQVIAETGDHPRWGLGRLHMSAREFLADLGQVRTDGYASRSDRYDGESRPYDRLQAIAVPFAEGGRAAGALTLIWPPRHLNPQQFAALYLSELRVAADRISSGLARLDAPPLPQAAHYLEH